LPTVIDRLIDESDSTEDQDDYVDSTDACVSIVRLADFNQLITFYGLLKVHGSTVSVLFSVSLPRGITMCYMQDTVMMLHLGLIAANQAAC